MPPTESIFSLECTSEIAHGALTRLKSATKACDQLQFVGVLELISLPLSVPSLASQPLTTLKIPTDFSRMRLILRRCNLSFIMAR